MTRTPRIVACSAAATAAVTALVAVVAVSAPAKPAPKPVPQPIASRPTTSEAWTARVLIPVNARSQPRARARKIAKLTGVAPYARSPEVLLVVGATSTARDGVWYQVLLNSRPNTATGWVPDDAVRVQRTLYRILVDIGHRRVRLMLRGRAIKTWKAAVGTSQNPTPEGSFAISEIVRQRRPSGFYGPYIITLTAHSETLNEFEGGDGRVALHGTNRPSLLGTAASHGCVRLPNAAARYLGTKVPQGTPVDVIP